MTDDHHEPRDHGPPGPPIGTMIVGLALLVLFAMLWPAG